LDLILVVTKMALSGNRTPTVTNDVDAWDPVR